MIVLAAQLVAWTFKFDKVTDLIGDSSHAPGLMLTLSRQPTRTSDIRSLVVSILVMVWALRIAGFLFLRVLVTGSDTRFDSIRSHFWSFKGFWIGTLDILALKRRSKSREADGLLPLHQFRLQPHGSGNEQMNPCETMPVLLVLLLRDVSIWQAKPGGAKRWLNSATNSPEMTIFKLHGDLAPLCPIRMSIVASKSVAISWLYSRDKFRASRGRHRGGRRKPV
ncbi:hypothetical protein BKA62DRAFT_673910 [Auriculariales sp. MPI-PUGE-AT-0066]|nr:hypothetical protein BKA62DRAFT_673910 [Auriculariales sp. MPI-PUGE-AT-0066]